MKRWMVEFVRRLVGYPLLLGRLDALQAVQARMMRSLDAFVDGGGAVRSGNPTGARGTIASSQPSPVEYYGDANLWELPIQLCARDFVSRDSVVLDIGGNIGALATAFSKMAPDGRVYTFEPNPEMWAVLHETLSVNAARNVAVVPLACYSDSLKLVKFYSDQSFYKARSRVGEELAGARAFDVMTVGVDDFCAKNSLVPAFVKIDVEGAEIHVLRSACATIERYRPAIVFEYRSPLILDEADPMVFLSSRRYDFYDVNIYERVSPEFYTQFRSIPAVNVLAIPSESRLARTYAGMKKVPVHRLDMADQRRMCSGPIRLDAGRHVVGVQFEMPDEVEGGLGIKIGEKLIAFYGAKGRKLKDHSNSNLVVELSQPAKITVELSSRGEAGASWLKRIDVHKLDFGEHGDA